MPTITLEHETLNKIQKNNGVGHDYTKWETWLPKLGCPVESNDKEKIEIEVFPDRPDLLSHETMAKAIRSFLKLSKESPDLEILKGENKIFVDKDTINSRPIIMSAIVKGVDTGKDFDEREKFIQSLMDHQEKLHLTLGRKRKFASIGVHDLKMINAPFRYITVPSNFKFTPLGGEKDMSIEEIIFQHPKGIEYSNLVDNLKFYPLILDSNNDVISFPPIINGKKTTVTQTTKDFFIDVTGWDSRACETCLLLICLNLGERGGKIESLEITYPDDIIKVTPVGDSVEHKVPNKLIKKILGYDLTNKEISESINKMGGELIDSRTVTNGVNNSERWSDCLVGDKEHIISMPRWRSDIMHPIDIVEDIAIGLGYDNLKDDFSSIHLDAIPLESAHRNRRIRESLRSLGLQETQSLTLSNERDQFDKIRRGKTGIITNISNPISKDHTILRQYILPSLMQLLASNRHQELPQRIYELGFVVSDLKNQHSFSWACAEVGGGFTAAKGFTQALLRDLGIQNTEVIFEATSEDNGPWLLGRGAKVIVSGIEIGQFGEIDPTVSINFGLRSPIHAGEFDIEKIKDISAGSLI